MNADSPHTSSLGAPLLRRPLGPTSGRCLGERDGEADARLVAQVRQLVGRYNRLLGSPLCADELDDVTQDVHLLRLRSPHSPLPPSWVVRLCGFRVIDAVRRKIRWRRRGGQCDDHSLEHLDAPTTSAHEPGSLLDQLPGREADVIRVKLADDLTFAEVGRHLRMPTNTAKTHYYRGLRRLRQRLRRPAAARDTEPE